MTLTALTALLARWRTRPDPAWPTHEPRGPVHFDGEKTCATLLREAAPRWHQQDRARLKARSAVRASEGSR
jgi:hypothetical protein